MMNPEVANRFKGDMSIRATGAKSIVAKAVENQRSMELLQATSNPMDMEVLGQEGRASLLRGIMRNYDMVDVAPTAEDMEKRAAEAAQQPQPPSDSEVKLQIEQIRADTRLQDQAMEDKNAQAEREVRLTIAKMEMDMKQLDLQVAQVQNKENNEAKMQQTALKSSNENARMQLEMAIKEKHGTGI